ncbi:MAG: SMC-Scp complex subunit ScpB [Clostridia bacterium]|nr:SMC-Scp complex subunit ScpB [Clostridia bacterium]
MKIADIARVIEAVVFVSGDGVDKDEFKRIYDLSDKELNKCLDILKQKYNEDSGINIITYKNKIQLCSNPKLADNVAEILNPIRERSLTKSALETIAIIAYKQPITRTEIEQIRGANSDYAMQLLQNNNLIEVVGRKDTVGKPLLFGTTENFLKRFELESLENLPNHKELLDRIRVLHSDGDSLYREFDIPSEENAENTDNNTKPNQENPVEQEKDANTTNSNEATATENNVEEVEKPKRKKSKSTELKTEIAENEPTANPVANVINQPKLSWRDKMKAKMAENAEHYENLDVVLEKKDK